MVICVLANGYPNSHNPQIGCFEKEQAIALRKIGHKIYYLYIDFKFSLFKHKIEINHSSENGIDIYGLTGFGFYWFVLVLSYFFNYKYNISFKSRMFEKILGLVLSKKKKPDIIYAHYLYNITYGVHLKNMYRIPLIGIEHWSELMKPKLSSRISYLGNTTYEKVDKLVAVSNSLANAIYDKFKIMPIVVNNMVGEEFVAQTYNAKAKNDGMFSFVAIGSLIPIKGFDILIDAFFKSKLYEKKCKLIIIGEGSERAKLQKQIERLSLTDSIVLVGRKTKTEIITYLQNSNVFVLSSHSETFSVVCIEAMALGLPVIATACGGPEEFVTEEVGLLVQPNDVDSLTEAMNKIYFHYDSFDNENIQNICRDKFAPEYIAKRLTDVFNQLFNK